MQKLVALYADRDGATAIEYGLIIALIASAIIVGMQTIGTNITAIFQFLSDTFTNAMA
ncbi:pilus assembly protein Flp/PilA [Rhizobium skierniewicense]|uniref:Pilus assembly protein Flp/PilA n=2 Tax=Rhizobium skierniewicense TaxID=984260 RepID=A0A7W6C3J3_9HYPH|nr:Flp family type IVb pilin [Rhizobium skierniewicense]MBB3944156.1 pilus assembly protein Flp/PilA [Rhizobium skierniewicense]